MESPKCYSFMPVGGIGTWRWRSASAYAVGFTVRCESSTCSLSPAAEPLDADANLRADNVCCSDETGRRVFEGSTIRMTAMGQKP